MRRRDANVISPSSGPRSGWPTALSFVCALAVHAGLIALSASLLAATGSPLTLIHITLRNGGGDAAPAGSTATERQPIEHRAPPVVRAAPAKRVGARQTTISAIENTDRRGATSQDSISAAAGGVTGNEALGGSVGIGNGAGAGGGAGEDGSDQRAACVYCPEPHYPLIARARGWAGTVDVSLSVLADGSVEGASLRRSSGYGALDDAAISVARRSRFAPPATRGLPTPLHGRIAYRFELAQSQ